MKSLDARKILQEENERVRKCFAEVSESCKRHRCRLVGKTIITTRQTERGLVPDVQALVDIEPIVFQAGAEPIVTPTGVDSDTSLRPEMGNRGDERSCYDGCPEEVDDCDILVDESNM